MKIIGRSNFNLDSVDDVLVAENCNEGYGQRLVNYLNKSQSFNSTYFYDLVPDDYKLYTFEP